jgi:hypothetical protein
VIHLKVNDIAWAEGRLIIRTGKNHRERGKEACRYRRSSGKPWWHTCSKHARGKPISRDLPSLVFAFPLAFLALALTKNKLRSESPLKSTPRAHPFNSLRILPYTTFGADSLLKASGIIDKQRDLSFSECYLGAYNGSESK